MAVFSYKGINQEGKEVKGVIEAPSKSAAYSLLKKKGIFPYKIEEEERREREKELPFRFKRSSPSPQELIVFLRTLSTLLSAGVPIVEAVESFAESEESKHLAVFFKKVASRLKEGAPLSTALREAGVKDQIVIALVKSGEKSGLLPQNLNTAAEIVERREELKGKLVQAFIYPSVLLTVAFGVVVFMMSVVIPKIVVIYKTARLSLPTSTKIVIGMSKFITANYPLLLGGAVFTAAVGVIAVKKKRETFDRLKLKLPLIGKMLLSVELQRFLETMGRLLSSGLPLIEALETASETVKNTYLKRKIEDVKEEVKKGAPLYKEFSKLGAPKVVNQLIKAGEKSGNLAQMCQKASNYLKNETEFKLKSLTSILEPATMLVLGLIIGFIIYALLLPIVSISTIRPL
ncbi:type II secretion system F family protein [Thermovibrio sp.]